jgi:hypothetical protein
VTEIKPEAVYGLKDAREALGVRPGTLPREIRLGRLRSSKRAGKVFILGEWLLEWLRDGERKRAHHEAAPRVAASTLSRSG